MAVAVLERKIERAFTKEDLVTLNAYLNRFFMARIGIRFLVEHHIASEKQKEGVSGIIHGECNPSQIAFDGINAHFYLILSLIIRSRYF